MWQNNSEYKISSTLWVREAKIGFQDVEFVSSHASLYISFPKIVVEVLLGPQVSKLYASCKSPHSKNLHGHQLMWATSSHKVRWAAPAYPIKRATTHPGVYRHSLHSLMGSPIGALGSGLRCGIREA